LVRQGLWDNWGQKAKNSCYRPHMFKGKRPSFEFHSAEHYSTVSSTPALYLAGLRFDCQPEDSYTEAVHIFLSLSNQMHG